MSMTCIAGARTPLAALCTLVSVRRRFRRLPSELSVSYALTAVAALLAVELVAGGLTFAAVGAPLAWLIASATLLGLVAAAAGTLFGLRARRQLLRDLLVARQELAALRERDRLARNLHENVRQQVSAISEEMSTARELMELGERDLARHPLGEAEELVQRTQRELTDLTCQLRPAALVNQTLAPALERWVAAWSRQSEIAADIAIALEGPVPAAVEDTLFRMAEEALANVARHGGASTVRIRLAEVGGDVTLEVSDDGGGTTVTVRCARDASPRPA
jgi:signal transduction histidine kinase